MSDELNEIWELYADEGQQSLQAAEEAVLFLKKSPSDKETISSLFRSVHTFKGNSRVMGLSVIESRAHVAEDLIGMVRDEGVPIDDEIIDLLLEMIDVLNDMLAITCETQNDAEPENSAELVDRLKQKIARCHSVESPKVDEPVLTEEELVEIDDDFFASAKKPDTEIEAEIDEVENQVEEVVEQETNGASYVLESEIPHDDDMHELFENASFVTESAMIFNPVDLASDPVYREMFATMARETLLEMQQSLTKFDANPEAAQSELHEQAEHIDFAAQQLNFFEWENLLVDFLSSSTFQKSDAENLFANLKALLQQDFGIELPDPNDPSCFDGNDISFYNAQSSNENQAIVDFFNEIKKPLGLVKAVYDASEFDSTQFINALDEIKTLASPLHFVQLETLIDDFVTPNRDATLTHQNVQDFLFWLFEALVAIEDAALEGQQPNVISHTKTLLGYFCSKHVFENLLLIESILEQIKNKSNIEESCLCINEALRKIYYACQHYGLETAAQLSTSLIDLFARVTNGDMVVDGFMLHIARSFVSDIELVLNSLESGISPDMGQIEKLLDDATSAAFVSSGAIVSASMIEARLGLPQSFHKILTTDSVKMAVEALGSVEV